MRRHSGRVCVGLGTWDENIERAGGCFGIRSWCLGRPVVKLTIAIPCFGQQGVLPELVASLQRLVAAEVLILDDGNPAPIAEDFLDPRVRVIRHEVNRGLAAARNTLVREAVGDLVLFLDADVVLEKAPAWRLDEFSSTAELAALTGRAVEDGSSGLADRWRSWFWTQDHGARAIDVAFAYGLCCVWRRATVLEFGGFDETLRSHGEDIDLSLRATGAGLRIVHDPSLVVRHRRRDTIASLLRMVWNHGYYFSFVCLRHSSPLYRRALGNAFKWLPTTVYSSLKRHRDFGMLMVSVPACVVSIAARLWAWVRWRVSASRR